MLHTVKLTGLSLRGKNKIREAGSPIHWTVLEEKETVGFSEKGGPWLHVAPDVPNGKDHSRWVRKEGDSDFLVEVVR